MAGAMLRIPLRELTALLQKVGGEGLLVPSPRTPSPLSALRASPHPTPKLVPTPLHVLH